MDRINWEAAFQTAALAPGELQRLREMIRGLELAADCFARFSDLTRWEELTLRVFGPHHSDADVLEVQRMVLRVLGVDR